MVGVPFAANALALLNDIAKRWPHSDTEKIAHIACQLARRAHETVVDGSHLQRAEREYISRQRRVSAQNVFCKALA
jgi:hypothetical protein